MMSFDDEREKRILTTHVGSLPRSDALSELMAAGKAGSPEYASAVQAAVADVVRLQTQLGIDIVNDGEQSKPGFVAYVSERLSGLEPIEGDAPQLNSREREAFPEFYAHGHSGTAPPRMVTTSAIAYCGHDAVKTDIDNLRVALEGKEYVEIFIPSASPASFERYQQNKFYQSDEECLYALAEAMREEYLAIVGAGFMLQIDDPRLAMHYMLNPQKSVEECRKWAMSRVEALNHALRGIPEECIRHHTCYGINMGPRVHDIEFKEVVDIALSVNAGYYSFEAANPRHEHEWRIWEDIKLPEGKAILPGVITHSSVVVEHPELVAERILRFAKLVGRENVIASSDCGFASTPRSVPEVHPSIVGAKFKSLSEGAAIASKKLW
ncbi:MAG: cobalamin-independent methionine synthase II family protein [Micropepsaceae bacterium]